LKTIFKNTWAILTTTERQRFTSLIILDVLISVVDILALITLLWIVQFYIQPGSAGRLSFVPDWLANRNSIAFIAAFFFLFGLKNIAGYLISRSHYKFMGDVAVRISRTNLSNYQLSGFAEFVNTDSSAHIRKIALQPFDFSQYILSGIQQIVTQVSLIVIAIISITIFNARLFLLLLMILLPPVIAVFYIIKKRLGRARTHIRSSNQRSYQHLLDALKGWVEANVYDRNEFFMQRFLAARKQFSFYLFESISIQNMPTRIIEIFAILGLFILIAIAKWTHHHDNSTFLTIGAFMAAAYKIIPGLVKIINVTGQMRAYEFSVSDLAPTIKAGKTGTVNSPVTGIHSLQLRNVSFHYTQQPVLNNLSLDIKEGDLCGITGISGKGKTTILNLVLGFLRPEKGEILINDVAADQDSLKKYWPHISYVRQQSFFIHDTIIRNITLQEQAHDDSQLQKALELSGLNDVMAKFPEGSTKIITENGKNISGGQQQRIAIARALYKDADLFLLDEPFNELDETSTMSLLEHFKQLAAHGKIVILITHDKNSLSFCNKIVSLDE